MEPLPSFIAVVEATVAADVSLGVLPIENSLHGPVAETHDLLYEAPLSIVSEVTLPIVHCLVAKSPIALADVTTLRSYPVAFDQCRELIHSLDVSCLPTATTADAAREVSESDDPDEAAIASVEAARALRPARDRRRRRRPAGRVHPLRRARPLHAGRRRGALAHRALVRHRPSAGIALSALAAVRTGTGSTSCSSCRGRSRTRPSATASTSCSTAIRSTTSCRRRSSRCASGRARCVSSAAILRRASTRRTGQMSERTLFERIWDAHVVDERPGEPTLLYVDLHLVHEVTIAAGVRVAPARRTVGAPARPDDRDDGSQRADRARSDPRPAREGAARRARARTAPSSACR